MLLPGQSLPINLDLHGPAEPKKMRASGGKESLAGDHELFVCGNDQA
jgi:hypothetical protein